MVTTKQLQTVQQNTGINYVYVYVSAKMGHTSVCSNIAPMSEHEIISKTEHLRKQFSRADMLTLTSDDEMEQSHENSYVFSPVANT